MQSEESGIPVHLGAPWSVSSEYAELFRRHYGEPRGEVRYRLVTDQISRVLEHSPARVLDVGCGEGILSAHFAKQGCAVTAIDPSPGMLEAARTRAEAISSSSGTLTVLPGSIADLHNYQLGKFDLVLCHGVLMYLPESISAIDQLASYVAPDGHLSLLTKNASALALRPGMTRRYSEALSVFGRAESDGWLGVPTRGDTFDGLEGAMSRVGLLPRARFGVGLFSDFEDRPQLPPGDLQELYLLDSLAAATAPYRDVSRLIHVMGCRVA